MGYYAIRGDAGGHDNGWPTTPQEALYDSAPAAQTTIQDDTLNVFSFPAFADLPADVSIKGIAVRLDGFKDEAAGSGTLLFRAQLSWDGGTSWTSNKATPLLGLSRYVYILGSPDDTWGRSWTRAELTGATSFQIRVTAYYKAVLDTPTWHLVYVVPVVFYEITTADQTKPIEHVRFTERVTTSIVGYSVRENIAVLDGGSKELGAVFPRTQSLSLAGTALTALYSTAGFNASSARFQRREAIGCMLDIGGGTFFLGDSTLATADGTVYPIDRMQPGLVSLGEVTEEASFGDGRNISACAVSLVNKLYVNQLPGSSATALTLAEHCYLRSSTGGRLLVWSFVESGDGWNQRVIFDGQVEDLDFEVETVTIRAVQIGTSSHPVPDIFVDSSLFTYEPGSSGVDTGEEVEGNRGKPVPIGLGRFDYGAVKKPADFASGHPFRQNNQSGPPSEDNKTYSQIALFPAMFGIKHPMMPTIHAAKRFRRKNAEVGDLQFTSWPYQNVFLFGSRKSAPELRVMTGPSFGSRRNFRFPGGIDTTDYSTNAGENEMEYATIWTWTDRGLPFVVPLSGAHYGADEAPVQTFAFNHSGAGNMDLLGYPFNRGATWSDGRAVDCYGIFVNAQSPRAQTLFPEMPSYPNARQAIALPVSGPTQFETRTKSYFDGPTVPKTPIFQMIEGTGQGFVETPRNAMDLLKIEDTARLQNMGYMSMRLPLDGPRLGPIRGIRICLLWNSVTTTAVNVYLFARLGPHNNYSILDASIIPDYEFFNRDVNVAFNKAEIEDTGTGFLHCYKIANLTTATFASMWMLPFFDPLDRRPTPMSDLSRRPRTANSPATPYATPKGEWNFTAMDFAGLESKTILEFPWDVMLHVRDLSGGTPIASRYIDLLGIWLEVMFDSPLAKRKVDSNVAGSASIFNAQVTQPQYDVRGRRLPDAVYHYPSLTVEPAFAAETAQTIGETVYVTGKGAQDDADGSITGAANRIIENPADLMSAIIRHYLGAAVFSRRATGSTFGSFTTARTLLGATTYRMAIVVNTQETTQSVADRIGRQSMASILEQIDANGVPIWRMCVDVADPATNDPQRMYRTDGFGFRWDHIAKASFRANLTPIEDLSSNIRLRFGLHLPTGTWSDEKYCTPDVTNFAADASTYRAAMLTTRTAFGVENPLVFDAPDIWDPTVAETLCKYLINKRRLRRVIVEFETYVNAMDLQPCHVIKMADEIGDKVKWPGLSTTSAWSSHQFNVEHVTRRRDPGQMARVFVRAIETHTTP